VGLRRQSVAGGRLRMGTATQAESGQTHESWKEKAESTVGAHVVSFWFCFIR
jgi:hypothetical protein